MAECIYYRKGYKYQLARDYAVHVSICPPKKIETEYLRLTPDGKLTIFKGYAWDGASGPTIDTKSSMRGSLVHDALYQLIRHGLLDDSQREKADELLYSICRDDGMMWIRANLWEKAVRWFASGACRPSSEPMEEVAP